MHKQLGGFIRTLAGTPEYLDGGAECTCGSRAVPAVITWKVQDRVASDAVPMRVYIIGALHDGDNATALKHLLRTAARTLSHRLISMGITTKTTTLVPMSRWEHEVLKKLIEGLSVQHIATALGAVESTIIDDIQSLHCKLGVSTRAALIGKYFDR